MLIKSKVANDSTSSFNEASLSDVEKELRSLILNEACTFKSIPTKNLKESKNDVRIFCKKMLNSNLSNKEFPDELKLADITPVYENDYSNKSKNCIPVRALPLLLKDFEKIMHDQISQYQDRFLTPNLCGYRKE